MRNAALLIFLMACGRSECRDYATVACGKSSACIVFVDQNKCEGAALRQIAAQRNTEEQCKAAREKIQAMNCAEFRAFIDPNLAQ